METGFGNYFPQPHRRRNENSYYRYAAADLTDINANHNRVTVMDYIFNETDWAVFMRQFVEEIPNNRDIGFIKMRVQHLDDRIFSWIFRKLDVYLIAEEDGDDGDVYELGDRSYSNERETRWLEHARLTGYTERYRDLLGMNKIVGTTLSEKVLRDAALAVIRNRQEPLVWKRSFGITALMISEPARFVPYKNVLAEKFRSGTEMLLAAEGAGEYDWAAYMPNHWNDYSKCARRFVSTKPVLYDPQSMHGAIECLTNPTAACRALSLKCYFYDDPEGAEGGSGGAGGGPGGRGGGREAHRGGREAPQRGGSRRGGVTHGVNVSGRNNANMATLCFRRAGHNNSQLISNVCTDALSAEKYYYFIRLMGRKASHVAVECTLRSNPNMVILAEEVAASKLTFFDITKQICDAVQARAEQGLIETIPEVFALLQAMMTVKHYGRGSGPGTTTIGKPVIHPATVDLRGKVYELLRQNATKFLLDDVYRNPGPFQFEGPGADSKAVSLCVEDLDYMGRIKELNDYLDKIITIVKPGCSQDVLKAALSAISSVTDILSVMTSQRLAE